MILNLLANRSNLSLINELRQRVNNCIRDMTFEVLRESKIREMFGW